MPGEADASRPIKRGWVVKSDDESDEEDTEMQDLTHAVEDCGTQLQYLTGRISKYMDNVEASTDEGYDYIHVYLGGLQKQSMVALTAIQIFIDWYWDKKEHAMDRGSQGTGTQVEQVPKCQGPHQERWVARKGEGVDVIKEVGGEGMADTKGDVE